MKQQRNSCFPSKVAGMALALIGLCALLGLGLTGEAQASSLAVTQSIAAADRGARGDYDATRVSRSPGDKKCPRSSNGCDKTPPCPQDATVCPKRS